MFYAKKFKYFIKSEANNGCKIPCYFSILILLRSNRMQQFDNLKVFFCFHCIAPFNSMDNGSFVSIIDNKQSAVDSIPTQESNPIS